MHHKTKEFNVGEYFILHLDHSLLDCNLSSHSSKSSSFQPGEMIGHGVGPYLVLDKIGSLSPMIILLLLVILLIIFFGFVC